MNQQTSGGVLEREAGTPKKARDLLLASLRSSFPKISESRVSSRVHLMRQVLRKQRVANVAERYRSLEEA